MTTTKTPRKGWRRTAKRIVLSSGGISLATLLVLFFVLQRKPAWYRPAQLDDAAIEEVRRETAGVADDFGDRLVIGRPFEMVLNEDQLNRWLAGARQVWPELDRDWPPQLSRPALKLIDDQVLLAAHVESKGWRMILSAALELRATPDAGELLLRLEDLYAGAMPIPQSAVNRFLARSEGPQHHGDTIRQEVNLADLFSGIPIRNDFVWPNGNRRFRVSTVAVADGQVRLGIEPRPTRR